MLELLSNQCLSLLPLPLSAPSFIRLASSSSHRPNPRANCNRAQVSALDSNTRGYSSSYMTTAECTKWINHETTSHWTYGLLTILHTSFYSWCSNILKQGFWMKEGLVDDLPPQRMDQSINLPGHKMERCIYLIWKSKERRGSFRLLVSLVLHIIELFGNESPSIRPTYMVAFIHTLLFSVSPTAPGQRTY